MEVDDGIEYDVVAAVLELDEYGVAVRLCEVGHCDVLEVVAE